MQGARLSGGAALHTGSMWSMATAVWSCDGSAGAGRANETASSPLAAAATGRCFCERHADVAVTYKQSICGWQVRCASEGKSVLERAGARSCHGVVASAAIETRPRRTDTAPFAGGPPSSSQHPRTTLRCAWQRLEGVAFGRCAGGDRDGN